MTTGRKEMRSLKAWLKKDGNTKAVLAARLGYTTSSTIAMWLKRGNVPVYQREKLMEAISQ